MEKGGLKVGREVRNRDVNIRNSYAVDTVETVNIGEIIK